ncbi:MAG: ABC transporter substrate-binding protein [Fusobacterium sp.]|uniref:ABC transporter substrate-binding protein n=1 Tax=Fusobacterium sp. TaxID=68766 RepID=UPI0026DC9611|nr:ABC transporter substrate-binding protein [Fusobacterium sp.]MDO4691139.1 ABC transporter substrate-binding protein [Fusobacterium sp.]
MKKILTIICFLISSIISFSINIEGKYIVDDYGNKIELKEYKRLLVTDPGVIEILFGIGGNDKIVAIAKTARSKIYPVEEVEKLNSVGNITNMNFEKMLEYKPDLVIVNSMMLKNVERIKAMNYNVIVSTASNLEEILDLIEVLGFISGKEDNAKALRESSQKKLNSIESFSKMGKKIKGVVVYSVSPMMAFTENSLPGDVLKHLGVKNIAADLTGNRPILSPEYILKENPDFIAGAMSLDNPKQILEASNVIPKTKAGRDNNIFILDSSSILRSSHRIFDEMMILKEKLEKIN